MNRNKPLYVRNDDFITQIGSLPHTDIEEALDYSMGHPIPFLPELQKRGEDFDSILKNPGQLKCLPKFKRYVNADGYSTIKMQVPGPATAITRGYDESEAMRRVHNCMSEYMEGLKVGEVIFFFDEPGLGTAGFDYIPLWITLMEQTQSDIPVIYGVHCCGAMDWDRLFRSDVDIISFDASRYDITGYPGYPDYRSRGKKISWGVHKEEDVKDWYTGDLLTPTCGMGTDIYTVKDAEKTFSMLENVARLV